MPFSRQGVDGTATEDIDDVFSLAEQMEDDVPLGGETPGGIAVQLELLTNREWVELGSRILILEEGSKDKSGLEGICRNRRRDRGLVCLCISYLLFFEFP